MDKSELYGSSAPLQGPRFCWLDSNLLLNQPLRIASDVIVDIHLKYLSVQLVGEERKQLIEELASLMKYFCSNARIPYFDSKTYSWSMDYHLVVPIEVLISDFYKSSIFSAIFGLSSKDLQKVYYAMHPFVVIVLNLIMQFRLAREWEKDHSVTPPEIFS